MARRFSIVLAVVLAMFIALPDLGDAQGRGGGWHGGAAGVAAAGAVAAGGGAAVVGAGPALAGLGSRLGLGLDPGWGWVWR
jgi:hypothetical protein